MDRIITDQDITVSNETQVRLPEHEVLVSFNSDWMAEAFSDWWGAIGQLKFIDWVGKELDHGNYLD